MKNSYFQFRERVYSQLMDHILPFWVQVSLDEEFGGFWGQILSDGTIKKDAPKGLILNSRILWSFSAAHRFSKDPQYKKLADRAFDYINHHFLDETYGGAYWMLDYKGQQIDDKKKIYGHAFLIYAFAEYYLAFNEEKAIDRAREIFDLVEKKSFDNEFGGYFESFNRDWSATEDLRLSEKDMNEKKSMNNHLHLLEAYTNLYRCWKDSLLKSRLRQMVDYFLKYIINPETQHFGLFFDEKWQPRSHMVSYGHDIEGSWLLCEAAEVLGDEEIISAVHKKAIQMADVCLQEGIDMDGGLYYEKEAGNLDSDKHWWPQAEAVVGFLNAFQISQESKFLNAAFKTWDFIEKFIVDRQNGEWFWSVDKNGNPDLSKPKVSEWKGPYHNSRTCIEVLNRLEELNM